MRRIYVSDIICFLIDEEPKRKMSMIIYVDRNKIIREFIEEIINYENTS
jgi:hypothetical protein